MIAIQDFQRAQDLLEDVIRQRTDAASPHYHLGFLYIQLKNKTDALTHFKQAAMLKPNVLKYKQVLSWFARLDSLDDEKTPFINNFYDAVHKLLNEINPQKFQEIQNATPQQTISALAYAIQLYHPHNNAPEDIQHFLLHRYTYICLTLYKVNGQLRADSLGLSRGDYMDEFIHWYNNYNGTSWTKHQSLFPPTDHPLVENIKMSLQHPMHNIDSRTYYICPKNGNYMVFLTKNKYKMLISGYIRHHIYRSEPKIFNSSLGHSDIINIIEPYANINTFIWKLHKSNGHLSSLLSATNNPVNFEISYDFNIHNNTDLFLNTDMYNFWQASFSKVTNL
eukprot:545932_1